jgi:hypothetical protein
VFYLLARRYRVRVPRRKQVYKITYPNGKIYVGLDLTGVVSMLGEETGDIVNCESACC